MALIKCIECGKEISDKSAICVHCGCPTAESLPQQNTNTKRTICKINGKMYDFSDEFPKICDDINNGEYVVSEKMIAEKSSLSLRSASILYNYIKEHGEFPEEFNGEVYITPPKKPTQPRCPKCGSTAGFTPVRRKFSPLLGFATNKIDMVCNNCGYVKR